MLRRPLGLPMRLLVKELPEVDDGSLDIGTSLPFMPFGDEDRLIGTGGSAL